MVAQNLAGRTVDNPQHPSQARGAVVKAMRIRPVRIENSNDMSWRVVMGS